MSASNAARELMMGSGRRSGSRSTGSTLIERLEDPGVRRYLSVLVAPEERSDG